MADLSWFITRKYFNTSGRFDLSHFHKWQSIPAPITHYQWPPNSETNKRQYGYDIMTHSSMWCLLNATGIMGYLVRLHRTELLLIVSPVDISLFQVNTNEQKCVLLTFSLFAVTLNWLTGEITPRLPQDVTSNYVVPRGSGWPELSGACLVRWAWSTPVDGWSVWVGWCAGGGEYKMGDGGWQIWPGMRDNQNGEWPGATGTIWK